MEKDQLAYEKQLIQACLRQEKSAQKALFEAHASKMLAICARYCTNMEDAKDSMHDGFIKVFKQLDKFKGDSKIETWMTRIMINTAIDRFKKSIKFKYFEDSDKIYKEAGIEEEVNIDNEGEKLTMDQLYNVINLLPDGYRVIFNMYAIEGYSHQEIANDLGISVGTSKSQLARARKQLQKLIKERFVID